ncbi:hypothetical protein UFOVP1299_24 [uncultured Caudovirales phage]|uniref:Uncharacterized protein n=1 Tax=uncultured Caudovirales phage TaxID=2100421 RepID=A0A6J5RN20_9CAUD|nr:hypothetical protein UFOVP1299_24 [uncultured Caudovirales phage]
MNGEENEGRAGCRCLFTCSTGSTGLRPRRLFDAVGTLLFRDGTKYDYRDARTLDAGYGCPFVWEDDNG